MPNYCDNCMTIRFKKASKLLRAFEDYEQLRRNNDASDGIMQYTNPLETEDGEWDYNTAVYQWGCKWDFQPDDFDLDGTSLYMRFQTAWSPPEGWVDWLEAHDDVEFVDNYFYEPGMAFVGKQGHGDFYSTELDTFIRADFDQRRLRGADRELMEFFDLSYEFECITDWGSEEENEKERRDMIHRSWHVGDPVSSDHIEESWQVPRGFFVSAIDNENQKLIIKNHYPEHEGTTWTQPSYLCKSPMYGVHFEDLVERNKELNIGR